MAKYIYAYETVSCEFNGWGAFAGNSYGIEDYRALIDARAKAGWRYVGFLPTRQRGTGHMQELDLIFEKEEEA